MQIRDHHVDDERSGSTKLKLHEEDNVQAKNSSLLTSRYHKPAVLARARAKWAWQVNFFAARLRARVFKPYHFHFLSARPWYRLLKRTERESSYEDTVYRSSFSTPAVTKTAKATSLLGC